MKLSLCLGFDSGKWGEDLLKVGECFWKNT